MSNIVQMTRIVSFSITAVARLGVPPGKWFCLARTGLGYGQYSCCVCGAHHDKFAMNWEKYVNVVDWKTRISLTINATLRDMNYDAPASERPHREADLALMKERIENLVFSPENYIINPWFSRAVVDPKLKESVRIISDGPRCLANMLFPGLSPEQIICGKSKMSRSALESLSDAHVGTNVSDLRLPQTVMLVNRKLHPSDFPSVKIVSRLTDDIIENVYRILG